MMIYQNHYRQISVSSPDSLIPLLDPSDSEISLMELEFETKVSKFQKFFGHIGHHIKHFLKFFCY